MGSSCFNMEYYYLLLLLLVFSLTETCIGESGSGSEDEEPDIPNISDTPIPYEEPKDDTKPATSVVLDVLLKSPKVKHIKSKDLLKGQEKLKHLNKLMNEVVHSKKIYTFDFSDTKGNKKEDEEVKKEFLDVYGFAFECELLIVTNMDGRLTFTP